MQRKHNKCIVPAAKMLRKNMTKEENHLWYDYLRTYPVRFLRQRVIGRYIVDFYCAAANWRLSLMVQGIILKTVNNTMKNEQRFLKGMD